MGNGYLNLSRLWSFYSHCALETNSNTSLSASWICSPSSFPKLLLCSLPIPFPLMSKILLPSIKNRLKTPLKPFLDRRTRKLVNSITQILKTQKTNPHWEQTLDDVFSPDEELAPVIAALSDADCALAFFDWARRRRPSWADPPDSLAYSALLRLLARSHRFLEIELTIGVMRDEKRTPTREALSALLAAYSNSGLEEKALEVYASMRDQDGSFPDVSDSNCLLKLLVERKRHDVALKMYDEMLTRGDGADNFSTCIIVRGLCIEGRMKEGKKLIEDRWGAGCVPNVVFYNTMIDGYCRHGDFKRAYMLFREMKLKGFLPTLVTYGIVTNALCKMGHFAEVSRLLLEMKARGVHPNVQIYNNLMDAQCKYGSILQAKVVLREMIVSGREPDVVTFNVLISAFCRKGKLQEAECLLREAINRRLNPNEFSYTPLIHGYCQDGQVGIALNLFIEMMEKGKKPDLVTFGALIHGLVVTGEVKQALAIREKMMERNVPLDCGIYNVLINGLCKKRMLPSAKKLLVEMLDQNILPDEFVYTTLIDGFIRNENLSEAKKIFEFMGQKGIRHGVVGYNALIKGYCKFGLMNDAILCMNNMERDGLFPDEFTYTTVISGYAKQGDLGGALRVLCDMTKRRCRPNVVTYSALIHGYCQKGDTDTAEGLFKDMQFHGLLPNVVTYTILIGSFFKTCKVVRAAVFFENMLLSKCSPNDVTFHYLINGLTNNIPYLKSICSRTLQEHSELAVLEIFVNMISDGWDDRTAAYNSIIFCLCKHNMFRKALEMRDKMKEKGCLPDSITFLSLLYGICAEGKSGEWKSILSCQFQENELEMVFRYKRLLDLHICQSVSSGASLILQSLLEENTRELEHRCAGF